MKSDAEKRLEEKMQIEDRKISEHLGKINKHNWRKEVTYISHFETSEPIKTKENICVIGDSLEKSENDN